MLTDCDGHGRSVDACFTQYLDLENPGDYRGDLIAPGATQGAWPCAVIGSWMSWVPTDRKLRRSKWLRPCHGAFFPYPRPSRTAHLRT